MQGADAVETARSGVSWGAILAGAAAASALSLVLYLLGSGLGLSAASPWSDNSGVAFGIGAILWLTLTQLAASAIGGYMAGRLRVKWASLHTDEVYFRDTAHGLLTWAVSTMLAAALFSGVISKMTGAAVDAGGGRGESNDGQRCSRNGSRCQRQRRQRRRQSAQLFLGHDAAYRQA
jgi:hypothetical protein